MKAERHPAPLIPAVLKRTPNGGSERQRQANPQAARAVWPHAQTRQKVGSCPVVAPNYRAHDRTDDRSGGTVKT